MAYQLGIDLGTTYTAGAVCRASDRRWVEPEVVTLGSRSATVPSVIFVAPDGSIVVGEAAERRAVTDPDRVVREFKRRIGDPTPVMVAGRPWAPQELSARLVRWVVDRVAEREGGPADRIAVTHPASWGQHKKDLLGGALARQGLTVTFLAEPQAAALHYAAAERVPTGATIAVYDLGGGTFDAAVVRKGDPGGPAGFGLLGRPQGLERLGGIDFDEAVFEHVVQGMPDAFAQLDESDPAVLSAVARLRRDCTEAKEALSSDTEVSIPVLLPAARGSVRLHRSEFEAMIRPQVEETVSALRSTVVSAGLAPEQLTAVLLVGGSSRIPLVSQLVSEQLGRPVAVDADPKNAIAKGAALAVSPKPTVSWPGVVVPPVAAAAAGAALGAPPPRPPRPGMAPPPPGGRPGYGPPAPAGPPPRDFPPRPAPAPPPRPVADPATAVMAQARPEPARRAPEPEWDDEPEYAYEEEEPRRPSGALIGVGAVLAAAAVVAAIVWWPDGAGSPGLGVDAGNGADVTTTRSAPATGGARDTGSAPAPAPGGGGSGPTSRSTTTTAAEPPTRATTTTTRPAEPTEDPDPGTGTDPGDGQGGDTDPGAGGGDAAGPTTTTTEPVSEDPASV